MSSNLSHRSGKQGNWILTPLSFSHLSVLPPQPQVRGVSLPRDIHHPTVCIISALLFIRKFCDHISEKVRNPENFFLSLENLTLRAVLS